MTGAEGTGPALCHRRCGHRRASGRDRRGRADHALITGGSGVAMGLPANFRARRAAGRGAMPRRCRDVAGRAAVLAGSCSRATLAQLGYARDQRRCLELDPAGDADAARSGGGGAGVGGRQAGRQAGRDRCHRRRRRRSRRCRASWAGGGRRAGRADAGARIAEGLVARGVRRLVVAGGETSGAVVARLGVRGCASAPRSIRACRGPTRRRRRAAAAGAEVGQFRCARLLPQGLSGAP